MIAFEVCLNGAKLCTAGVGDLGVLSAILCWVRREGESTQTKEAGNIEEELTLDVSGLIHAESEQVHWSERQVSVGDEVNIRIVNVDAVDIPTRRLRNDPEEDKKNQERYVEQMAKQLGWSIQK
jgi:predicted RNA-binding protein with RPS1 domain